MNIIICMKYSSKYDFNDGCNHINPYDLFAIKSAITLNRQAADQTQDGTCLR